MDELCLDRTRTYQRHLDNYVVEPVGFRVQHRCDLCSTLDLERSDSLAGRDQIVSRLIVGRQFVHLWPGSGAHLDHVERASHQ